MDVKQIRNIILTYGYRSAVESLIYAGCDPKKAERIVHEQHALCSQYHVAPDGTIREIDEIEDGANRAKEKCKAAEQRKIHKRRRKMSWGDL